MPYSLSLRAVSGIVAVCFNIVRLPYRNIRQHHRILQGRKAAVRSVLLVQPHGTIHTPSTAFRHLLPHSEHRFPAPSLKEGCRKPVLGVWVRLCSVQGRMVGHVTSLDVLWSTWAGSVGLESRKTSNQRGESKSKSSIFSYFFIFLYFFYLLSPNPTFWRKVTFLDKTYSDRNQFKFQTLCPAGRPFRRPTLVVVGYIMNRPRAPVDSNLLVSSLKVYY